ncbi:MAG: hypothetical protein SFU91_07775 [Chloroherpetonaceae bacterium]|nr:hypothetical protein [Chloroherpetonaceae bacterium]
MNQDSLICSQGFKKSLYVAVMIISIMHPVSKLQAFAKTSVYRFNEEEETLVKKKPLKFFSQKEKLNQASFSQHETKEALQIEMNRVALGYALESEKDGELKLRSPFLAAVFSAVVPGLGELYAESYWKAAMFIAIEGFLWYRHISLLNEGHRAEQNFVAIANDRWSPLRYAERLKTIYASDSRLASNGKPLSELAATMDLTAIAQKDFRTLNQFERLALYSNGNALSHTLPSFGSQQYYELIGKYDNFFIGWDDYDESRLSANFAVYEGLFGQEYAQIRQNANDILSSASTFISIIILNHVLSLADAIWSTAEYNKSVRAYFQMSQNPMTGYLQPEARVSIDF